MLKQVVLLAKLQLQNLFGINEVRFTKDQGKKLRYAGLCVAWLMVFAMVILYVGGLAYGLHFLGVGEIVPVYLYTLVSLVMVMLSFFKAGSVLFSMKFYDVMVSLPVSRHAILASRFFTMYVSNLLIGTLVLLPGMAVHIWFAKPDITFYLISFPVVLLTPLLPLTVSSVIAALIKSISSRMKSKTLVETLLMVLLVVGVLGGSMFFGEQAEELSEEALRNLAVTLTGTLGSIFPPAVWYFKALQGNFLSLLPLLLLPIAVFTLFIALLGKFHQDICTRLNAVSAKQNYKVDHLESSGILWSLCKKEAKLYFSSSLYVTNTIVGYVLAVLLAAGVGIAGVDTLTGSLELPGEFTPLLEQLLPFFLTLPLCMMNLTSCSISMEGKQYWQFQVLPLRAKDIYDAKILWNLMVAAPFYVVSVLLLLIFVKPSGQMMLHYILLPLIYLVFDVVLGLFVNLLFPLLNWENETRVVKQSASVFVSMLGGMVAVIVPIALTVVLRPDNLTLYLALVEVVLALLTAGLYLSVSKKELCLR